MATTLKPLYAASVNFTTTGLASLASDASMLAGWQSAVVDNTTNLYDDVLVAGVLKTGTTPTVGTPIEVWAYSILNDTPTYPDTITGSVGALTLSSLNTKNSGGLKQAAYITVDASTGQVYSFAFSLAGLFLGFMPKKWGLFIVQGTGAALNATQVVSYMPMQWQSV